VTKSHELRKLAAQIEKYGTRHFQIALTDSGEADIVEALRFQADALENAAHLLEERSALLEKSINIREEMGDLPALHRIAFKARDDAQRANVEQSALQILERWGLGSVNPNLLLAAMWPPEGVTHSEERV
jgi:hypothetical protein